MKRLFAIIFFPLWTFAQPHVDKEIWGTWKGYVKTSEKTIDYELVVGNSNGTVTAFSKIVFNNNGEEFYAIKSVLVKKEKDRYIFEEDKLLSDNFTDIIPKKIRQINSLEITGSDNELVMSGTFKTKPVKELRVATGDISVHKSVSPDSVGLLSELKKLGLATNLVFDSSDPLEQIPSKESDIVLTNKNNIVNTVSYQSTVSSADSIQSNSVESVLIPLPEVDNSLPTKQTAVYNIVYSPALPITVRKRRTLKYIVPAVSIKSRVKYLNANTNPPAVAVAPKPQPKTATPAAVVNKTNVAVPVVVKPAEKPVASVPAPVISKPAAPAPIIAPGSASDLNKRKIETIQTVYFDSDSLKLTLYDNGEVDGDTVSVVVNGKVIMGKKGLSTNAITETIYMTPELGDSLQMIMYAENLGSIGANTGLLIVQDGKDRYEIRFSGDLNKNAAVIFKRRK
jgi:hypothetical protein